jgi:serine/threonine protein kinase
MIVAANGILQGINHIHNHGIVHRDIKAENFLCSQDDLHGIKLCDFGLSIMLPKSGKLSIISGTAPYMSPEMLNYEGYDAKTDVWSFGVIVYAMMFDEFPYMPDRTTSEAMKTTIRKGIPEPRFAKVSGENSGDAGLKDLKAFAKRLLRRRPEDRPTALEALQLLPKATPSAGNVHDESTSRNISKKPTLLFSFDYRVEAGKADVPGAADTQDTMPPPSSCDPLQYFDSDSEDEEDNDKQEFPLEAQDKQPNDQSNGESNATPNRPFKDIVGMVDTGLSDQYSVD